MLIQAYMPDEYMTIESPMYEKSNIEGTVVKIDATKALYQKVMKMKQALTYCDASYIEDWDYVPEWEELTLDGQELVIDCCRLSVTSLGNMYWHGVVKHSNMTIHTEEISINKLFNKFINESTVVTGTNNSRPYEDLKEAADFAVDGFDLESCIQITRDYILDSLDNCTDKELKEQLELYGWEDEEDY